MAITAPKGTQDILPSESYRWQFIEQLLSDTAKLFGFREIRTPVFEQMELFKRGVGDTTDVVQKEMFEVKAEKGNDLFALRPEGTAGTVRAALENGLLNDALPLKAYYIDSCFRHERPQAGRLRQFHQFGCELFGSKSPMADVEVISIFQHVIHLLGLKDIALYINSIGCKSCRGSYYQALKEYFKAYEQVLCPTCLTRLEKNPMRILDCKEDKCKEIAKNAPKVLDYLCEECKSHFESVKKGLDHLEISYQIDPTIVRGLDYYTKTVFEFISKTQKTVCAGGRYDGLVEELGGKPTPALGFGMGIERLLYLLKDQEIILPESRKCDLYIGSMGEAANQTACQLAKKLRDEGFYVECDLMERSVKAQMKYANKLGASMSLILGEEELSSKRAKIKDMSTGEQKEIAYETELANLLYDAMLANEADAIAAQIGPDAFEKIMKTQK